MIALVIGATLLFAAPARAEREVPYTVEARLLGGLMRFEMHGTLVERVDPGTGRFAVRANGRGSGIETLLDSRGVLHENRWVPEATVLHVSLWGRIYRTELQHDVRARLVRYRSRGESFFLRQLRLTDDTLTLEPGLHIDDLCSAYVNYAERRWAPDAGGVFRTHLVRRSENPQPGPDGRPAYRAELRPLVIEPSRADGEARATALIDITGFSSWALATWPARVAFGADRRPERIDFRLRYGTTVAIRFGATPAMATAATLTVANPPPRR